MPEPAAKAQAVRRWLTHLEQGYRAGASQNVWFGFLTQVMRSDKRAMAMLEMLGSRNPVIAAYAQWMVAAQEKTVFRNGNLIAGVRQNGEVALIGSEPYIALGR